MLHPPQPRPFLAFLSFFLFFNKFIYLSYLFYFCCVGSPLLRTGPLQLWRAGASHCSGLSRCGAWAPGTWASVVVACRLTTSGLQALERRLSRRGARAQLLCGIWDPPGPGLEPTSPALAGGFLTTAPPGKPLAFFSFLFFSFILFRLWFCFIFLFFLVSFLVFYFYFILYSLLLFCSFWLAPPPPFFFLLFCFILLLLLQHKK